MQRTLVGALFPELLIVLAGLDYNMLSAIRWQAPVRNEAWENARRALWECLLPQISGHESSGQTALGQFAKTRRRLTDGICRRPH